MMSGEQPKEIWLQSKIKILVNSESTTAKSIVTFMGDEEAIGSMTIPEDPRRFIDTESVCTLIKEAHKNKSNLELVFDGEKLWQVRSNGAHVFHNPEVGVPLEKLLVQGQSRLKLKASRTLAVVLAHAILHYCESPWVSNSWDKQHVSFFKTANGPDLMRPYLATQFAVEQTQKAAENLYLHPSPALLSLGILLLEIHLSKPIESLWDPDDLDDGVEGVNTNWITAEKQLKEIGDDLYEGYRNAIEACLNVNYMDDIGSSSLNDEEFRRLIYERVIIPLEDELENGFHITPEELGALHI